MRYYVEINGNSSLDIEGLAIKELPPITKPLIRSQIEEIDGRDGDIVTELGYSAYDKSIEIGLYGNFDIDAIIKYFTGEGTITFSNEPDKFYYFKILNQIDYEKLLKFKTAVVTFHCQPFKYPVEETPIDGEAITVTGSGSNITLENTVVAPMDMKLKGNTIQDGTPTPTTPIPVQVVSGDNSIEVCGKNLFDDSVERKNAFPSTTVGSTITYTNSGATYSYVNGAYLKAGETYTISWTQTTTPASTNGRAGAIVDKNNIVLQGVGTWTNSANYITFTPTTTGYLVVSTDINATNIQIELGSTATTYEAYTGASYPISLSSINLFDLSSSTFGYRISVSGEDYVDSSYYISPYIKVKPSTQYTKNSPTADALHRVAFYTNNNVSSFISKDDSNNTFTTPNNCQYLRFCGQISEMLTAQLNKGNTVLPYTPYFTPIELNKIGTYQDKIDKSTGKNLFNPNIEINSTYNSSIATALSNFKTTGEYAKGYISTQDTIQNSNEFITAFINCESGVTYTINNTYSAAANLTSVIFLDNNGNIISRNSAWSNNAYTHTATSVEKYIMVGIKINDNGVDYRNWVMLNVGETALPYEPYGTGWYLKKEIGKYTFTGNENFSKSGYTTNAIWAMYFYSASLGIDVSVDDGWCDFGEVRKVGYINVVTNGVVYNTTTTNTFVKMQTSQITNWDDSATDAEKIVLAKNMIIGKSFYYPLATPTYETITDTTLIGQLEALKPYSYNPTTNITQTNNDAPFELDVSLSYTNTMNVNNVGNIYAKPILTIEGSGTIGIILNDIEVLSVDLGTDEKITIDVPNLQAYNPDNDVLLNRNVTGDYMKLLINDGDNTIAFSGSVTSATLTNYTRWI